MKIVIVKPGKVAEIKDVDFGKDSLSVMQNLVSGKIQPIDLGDYGYSGLEYVTLVINEEGLNDGLPFNRAVVAKHNDFDGYNYGDIASVACGDAFFIGYEKGHCRELTEEEIKKIIDEFGACQMLFCDEGKLSFIRY